MELIFGGAYQGRLEYAKSKYNLRDEDIFFLKIDASKYKKSRKISVKACIFKWDGVFYVLCF